MAPLPPKKPSKFVISSSMQASSASPGASAGASPAWASRQSPSHAISETLALLTEAELVETLMDLHLPPMVGRLLANQML